MARQMGTVSDRVSGQALPAVINAIWWVMKRRETQHLERVLEFLEITHEQVPGLLCARHHAKLSAGLRGKIVLDMIEKSCPLMTILKALNFHFPPVLPDDSRAKQRDLSKLRQCHLHFRRLVLHMIRDEKFRRKYVETKLQSDYGETFMVSLEKLLWEFLFRLQTVLKYQVSENTDENLLTHVELSAEGKHNFTDTSTFSAAVHTEDSTVRKKSRENCTINNKTCTEGDHSHSVLQTQCETEQNSAEPKQSLGNSKTPVQLVAESESSLDKTLNRAKLDTVCEHVTSEQKAHHGLELPLLHNSSVFNIFGFDCSERQGVHVCENLSPPDPFVSQDANALCGRSIVTNFEEGSVPVSDVCNKSEKQGTLPESDIIDCTSRQGHSYISALVHVSGIENQKESTGDRNVPSSLMTKAGQDAFVMNPPISLIHRKLEGKSEHSTVFTIPPVNHLSPRYQPMVHLTRLPMNLVNAHIKCQRQVNDSSAAELTSSAELSQVRSLMESEVDPSQLSISSDNLSSDPDYYPSCSY
ncbi:TERF1-interacting nuclear factor 2 [Rhinophrynus dorsalis]